MKEKDLQHTFPSPALDDHYHHYYFHLHHTRRVSLLRCKGDLLQTVAGEPLIGTGCCAITLTIPVVYRFITTNFAHSNNYHQ